jgi:hypothetical protein
VAAIAEFEAECGPIEPSPEDQQWVAAVLADAGVTGRGHAEAC